MYPRSTGGEHKRSTTKLTAEAKMFPCSLREAGYHTTNNAKEDYNLEHAYPPRNIQPGVQLTFQVK